MSLTKTGRKVIHRAFLRGKPYCVCPTPGLGAAAQTSVLRKLENDGFIKSVNGIPVLADKGISSGDFEEMAK